MKTANKLTNEMFERIETEYGIKANVLNYIFAEYPKSHYDTETNAINIKGKSVEKLTYFILGESNPNLITIEQVLDIVREFGININSAQTVRNYIHNNKLPNAVLYIGRFSYFYKPQLLQFLKDTYE